MDQIFDELLQFFNHNPKQKQQPSYLDIKNGKLPVKIGFPLTLSPFDPEPSLILNTNFDHKQYSLASSSIPIKFSFRQMTQPYHQTVQNRIVNHVVEHQLLKSSLKYLKNQNNQIRTVQNQLTQIMEDQRINVDSFSVNSLTNIGTYDYQGNLLYLDTINIEPQSKKYTQQQVLDRAPHPIHMKRKKKKLKQEQITKKSQRQVLEEFNILSELFTLGNQKLNSQDEVTKQKIQEVLKIVSLSDQQSYNDLWQQIVAQLQLGKQSFKKNEKVNANLSDKDFTQIVDRIMKEATEYQQQTLQMDDEQNEKQIQQEDEAGQKNQHQITQQSVQERKIQLIKLKEEQETKQKEEQQKSSFQSIRIQKISSKPTGMSYQFAVQDNTDLTNFYDLLPKQKFAIQYPFQLDQFQKRSILHLQKKETVFVAAHTSAGKTVVAQYGIALANKHKRKVIYTSPIKALSNQKYRQLSQKFESVGIVTGDVSLNSQASCIIMTTEILRNNLYRGAQMIRDIEWVIFDQVHYINNQQRGVVWEQTIIMLPEHIGIIMLSATVPNYMEFANWVGRTKRRMVYVMKTFHRPVPLEHSLFIFGKFHVIKQANGRFLQEEYNELKHQINLVSRNADDVKKALKQQKKKKIQERGFYNDNRREQKVKIMNKQAVDKFIKKISKTDMETSQGRQEHRILEQLIVDCHKKKLLPCVIFTFSKKKINSLAGKIFSYDLTNSSEKSKIRRLISHALSTLRPEDRQIHQFQFLTMICMNGYAIHHGDLLPLAKQIVELLFSQGLIKVLFATETFAMGINMPTKTVIFNSIKKVTGSDGGLRFLNSSQYVQMSGRAGRRGLDQKGTVIVIVKDPSNLPETQQMIKMIDHPGERLQSKFRITYKIILNLLNSKDMDVRQMMRQSFLQNPKFSQYASNIKKTKQLKNQFQYLSQFDCPFNKLGTRILIQEYNQFSQSIRSINWEQFNEYDFKKLTLPRYGKLMGHNNELQTCFVLKIDQDVRNKGYERFLQVMVVNQLYLGLQLSKEERQEEQKKMGIKKKIRLEYDQNLAGNKESNGQVQGTNNKYHYYIYWIKPSELLEIYENKLAYQRRLEDSKQVYSELGIELLPQNIPKKLLIYAKITPNLLQQKKLYFDQYTKSNCHNCQMKDKHQYQYQKRVKTKDLVMNTVKSINKNQLGLLGSFEGMIKLLDQFNFIKQSALTLKGRLARQIDIYVAQVIVQAVLDPLNQAQLAALLSAFVCDFKPRASRGEQHIMQFCPTNSKHRYTDSLDKAIAQTLNIVTKITDRQLASQSYINAGSQQELIFSIVNFHLCDTVYKWAIGFDFAQAIFDSGAPEGTIVKTIVRLNMLMSNLKSVCRLMGNSQLQRKIDASVEMIKRDIVFCQSLYLSG